MKKNVDVDAVRERATGQWPGILLALGVPQENLVNKHTECPLCGSKKKFRFDDKGIGKWICTCGNGDGFKFVMQYAMCNFIEAVRIVAENLGMTENTTSVSEHRPKSVPLVQPVEPTPDWVVQSLQHAWHTSKRAKKGDVSDMYLIGRGLNLKKLPRCLRTHTAMTYKEGSKSYGKFNCMLPVVSDAAGKEVSLHRIYFDSNFKKLKLIGDDGEELPAKKLMTGMEKLTGGAIRLIDGEPFSDTLAIAEGVETALAVHLLSGLPVWSTINAGLMQSVVIPSQYKRVMIYADNDAPSKLGKRAGQEASAALAERLRAEGRHVEIFLPEKEETDWLDIYLLRNKVEDF